MNTQRNFGRNVAANLLARTWAGVLWFALVPAYLAFLGPEAYGLVGLYLSLSMIVQLPDLGLSPTMTRELSRASGVASRLAALKDLTATALIIAASLWSLFTLTASGWLQAAPQGWTMPVKYRGYPVRHGFLTVDESLQPVFLAIFFSDKNHPAKY